MPLGTAPVASSPALDAYKQSAQKAAATTSTTAFWQSFNVGLKFKPTLTLAEHEATVNSYIA